MIPFKQPWNCITPQRQLRLLLPSASASAIASCAVALGAHVRHVLGRAADKAGSASFSAASFGGLCGAIPGYVPCLATQVAAPIICPIIESAAALAAAALASSIPLVLAVVAVPIHVIIGSVVEGVSQAAAPAPKCIQHLEVLQILPEFFLRQSAKLIPFKDMHNHVLLCLPARGTRCRRVQSFEPSALPHENEEQLSELLFATQGHGAADHRVPDTHHECAQRSQKSWVAFLDKTRVSKLRLNAPTESGHVRPSGQKHQSGRCNFCDISMGLPHSECTHRDPCGKLEHTPLHIVS